MNKKIGFLVAAIGIFCFFYFVIPVTFVHSAQMFWGFVGSILTGVCIFLIGYQKQEDLYDINNYKKNNGKQTAGIVLGILVAVAGAFILYMNFESREKKFIEANPVLVSGTVVDGKSTTTKRRGSSSTTYELNVTYKDSNAIEYKTDADVNSTEWEKSGRGMSVSVVYEKNNPEICKVILSSKDAMAYVKKGTKIFPTLKDLQAFLQTDDYNEQKKLLGQYWRVDKMEDVEDAYQLTNEISKDNLAVVNFGNIYVNEDENDISYNEIMKEAKATMRVVYDSMATNTTRGLMLENDSMQIRFQNYSNSEMTKMGGEFNFSIPTFKKIYCFGFGKKNKTMILPGDLKGLDLDGEQEEKTNAIAPEEVMEILKSKTK